MDFTNDNHKYKLTAPNVDSLLRCFDRNHLNSTPSTPALLSVTEPVFRLLLPLAPLRKNNEAKAIWLKIPRGTIDDYDSFEEMKEYGEVETYEEYEKRWVEDYPEEYKWYELVAVRSFDRDGSLRYYGISLGNKSIISAILEDRSYNERNGYYNEEAACTLCRIIAPAVRESMDLLKKGYYNNLVEAELPYEFRTGVIRRADLWAYEPECRKNDYDGLTEEAVLKFKGLIRSGANDETKIGRITSFTAIDFFEACKIGYEAIGKDCSGYSPSELYLRYSDGRDEGLTGKGHGLNAGPGIAFDSPEDWDKWYFGNHGGGHPWEVVPGGNSTHMELYVMNDKRDLEWKLRSGKINEDEYREKLSKAGYYFMISGVQRQFESISFYNALIDAGLPVVIEKADELLARFEATDYIGVVPHHLPTRYCESLFPSKYGKIIDFTHVYKSEDRWFGKIEWLPEEPAFLF